MRNKEKQLLPVDINLPERVRSADGTMFVTLRTLDELARFWQEHKGEFEFACEGKGWDNPIFLRGYEWVFGTSKSAVVRTVMRWSESGVSCQFYEWAKNEPEMHRLWFIERDEFREYCMERGSWTDKDEANYKSDCIRRSPSTYYGWWDLKDIPGGMDPLDWFRQFTDAEELIDPNMPIAEVEKTLQEQTFDDWRESEPHEIEYHTHESIEETIAYWRTEQSFGQSYYGDENEIK